MKLCVVIPCYNEARNIPLLLQKLSTVMDRDDVEVLLVDNGSTDETEGVLGELLPRYPFARSVKVEVNQGYGFGILSGLKEADAEYIGWTHADMQTDPHDILKALDIIESKGSPEDIYVKGLRKGRPFVDQFFTFGMSAFESVYLMKRLYDINAQPNIFHRKFFESWESPPHDFSLDLYVLFTARRQGLKLVRFPVQFAERIHGQSNWNMGLASKWKFIKRTFDFSLELKRRMAKSNS